MKNRTSKAIVDILGNYITDHKRQLIDHVLQKRTRQLTLVFEDIMKPHNTSAVLRTADCMGIQDLHFIANNLPYEVKSSIAQGAAKWVTIHHHDGAEDNLGQCYQQLHEEGYLIFATTLDSTAVPIQELPVDKRIALVFGTESDGISEEAAKRADGMVHIPMDGFTESLNLSVSAAISITELKNRTGGFLPLNPFEQEILKAEWYQIVVKGSEHILDRIDP